MLLEKDLENLGSLPHSSEAPQFCLSSASAPRLAPRIFLDTGTPDGANMASKEKCSRGQPAGAFSRGVGLHEQNAKGW